ncbi:hypothetical protein GQ43DRAFT_444272 [Delitschia confertaspora ATCC 74209]|uniref:DUF3835 domain-containing protein n=1 Tax=Delitschia confertaspora ATCC 74209 TaxID=1513339 RepID=A0A9P4MLR6_9PLEO|nr:hypothetical protein GQ43DRAFT_444272 [Delitschia confertaspora ATCC 74209]
MTAPERDPIMDLERHRQQLEDNVSKLRQALKHWQTWEIEYETLKEEIEFANLPEPDFMLTIARNLGGTLVNEKEVEELLGPTLQTKRNAAQVIDMITRRVDYVQQNIITVEKQVQAAEKKLNAASVLLEPDMDDEEGLPLTDIVEELDEEGNVVSSSVSLPGKAAEGIMNDLQRVGVTELGEEDAPMTPSSNRPTKSSKSNPSISGPKESATEIPKTAARTTPKKSVSFSEDTKQDPSGSKTSSLESHGYNPELNGYTFNRGTKVIEVDENDNEVVSYPIIPTDESSEDAALRREMIQYGLSEVGQVVAEIDLDERGEEDSNDDDDFEEYDEDFDSDEDEEEDEHGRSIRPVLTEEYKRQMAELEKKLNGVMIDNLGPRPDMQPLAEYVDDVRTLVIKSDEKDEDMSKPSKPEPTKPDSKKKKKGVRFAEELDVSLAPKPAESKPTPTPVSRPTSTIAETIVERAPSAPVVQSPSDTAKPANVSRFKSARSNAPQSLTASPFPLFPTPPSQSEIPQGPPGRTLADSVVEHAVDPSSIKPPAEDGLDPELIDREVRIAYNKARNKMIQQQGGFLAKDDEENGELIEEGVDGKPKKVSRFRAARLRGEKGF